MKKISNVYLIGLGAIGSMVALRLQQSGSCTLKIIVDAKRRERYIREGVYINDEKYSFNYICAGDEQVPADLIIVAVKNYHLEQTIEQMKPFVGKETAILSLLNGIDSELVIGHAFGMEKMLYSFYVATDALRIGTHTRYSSIGRIVFGEKENRAYSDRIVALKNLFEQADLPTVVPDNILREMWWKFMMNVGINQTSAILKANYGVYQKSETARSLMRDACLEVVRIAEKMGINLTEPDIDTCIEIVHTLSAHNKTSMLQDVEAGRKTEVETFSGTVIRMGEEYGVPTPINSVLYKMIKTIEEKE